MASYISVPRDLTKVKSKVIFNLTKRQLICFSLGALIGVPTFFLLRKLGGNGTVAAMGMMVVMMPLFFLAMYERNGQPLEVFLGHFIDAVFVRPKQRPYKTNNYYSALMRQAQVEMEVKRIVESKQDVFERKTSDSGAGKSDKGRGKAGTRDYQEGYEK